MLHYLCRVLIFTTCLKIVIEISSRYNESCATTSNLELYNLCHLKLAQLLIDGDIESNPGPVNYTETPKGKGRPKKTSKKTFNFAKPRVLDFNSAVTDNRFKGQSNLIHLLDIQS